MNYECPDCKHDKWKVTDQRNKETLTIKHFLTCCNCGYKQRDNEIAMEQVAEVMHTRG